MATFLRPGEKRYQYCIGRSSGHFAFHATGTIAGGDEPYFAERTVNMDVSWQLRKMTLYGVLNNITNRVYYTNGIDHGIGCAGLFYTSAGEFFMWGFA